MRRIFFTQSLVPKACPSPLYSSMTFEPLPSYGCVFLFLTSWLDFGMTIPGCGTCMAMEGHYQNKEKTKLESKYP